jgi:hypothetical protein
MPAITPEFLFDLESNMRLVTSREYERLLKKLWWRTICKEIPSGAKKERISWLLDSAKISRTTRSGGQVKFEDIVSRTTEYENENAAAGLKLKKEQLEDLDGNGVDLAAHWSRQMGAYAAYWPQKMLAKAIRDNGTTYDGKAFFATDHPVNPFRTSYGGYSNKVTDCPIDTSVSVDTAVENVAKVIAHAAGYKMPNGEDPRSLQVAGLIVPPKLTARAQQITNAKYIAQDSASAGGSGDIEAVVRNFGLGQPIVAPELGAAFGGSDTTYYIAMEEITSNELGAFVYVNREPFGVIYHGPQTDAQLARLREFQWTTEGRNTIGLGHSFLLIKCQTAGGTSLA